LTNAFQFKESVRARLSNKKINVHDILMMQADCTYFKINCYSSKQASSERHQTEVSFEFLHQFYKLTNQRPHATPMIGKLPSEPSVYITVELDEQWVILSLESFLPIQFENSTFSFLIN
ncbi:hypothetical protein T05_9139, partial [Trichinella murrelli]